jgi:hypothetical protein
MSLKTTSTLVLVADVFREQEFETGRSVDLAEVGARYRLTPYAILTAGTDVGFGADAPEFRGTTGLQFEFFDW